MYFSKKGNFVGIKTIKEFFQKQNNVKNDLKNASLNINK